MQTKDYEKYADDILAKAHEAAKSLRAFDQEQVDKVVKAVFEAAFNARLELARMAYEETGIGILQHKVIKNCWASLLVYEDIKNQKTVGEISDDPVRGITEIAQPHGPLLALTPLTNPTSTTIFKCLIAMKTRNPLIFSFHRSARKCSTRASELLYTAALEAGAPENCIQWITKKHPEYLKYIMKHRKLALIIATGTPGIVNEANISGKPTIGVGPGNVPAFVDETADIDLAAESIVLSKSFDNGAVCASEQALVVEKNVDKILKPLLEAKGCYFCTEAESHRLGQIAFDAHNKIMRAEVVGRSPEYIAEMADFSIPKGTKLLIAPCTGVGKGHPLSYEILTPILAYYRTESYKEALETCSRLNALGGQGHTVSIYTKKEKVIKDFSTRLSAGRICINTPATQGAIGGTYNALTPSLTLSCGTQAGNIFTDNITTSHLLNIHRIARRKTNSRWFSIKEKTWQDAGVDAEKIRSLYNRDS